MSSGDDAYALKSNGLNQYDTRENNTLRVLGTAAAGANVAALASNSTSPIYVNMKDRSFAADVIPLNNANNPAQGTLSVTAAVPNTTGGADAVDTSQRTWQIAQQLQSFSYDADGNLTGDGVWSYAYDAENRLIRMETTNGAIAGGLTQWILEFKYDYMGRRVQKHADNVTRSDDRYTRYLYDGWNLVAEFDAPGGASCGTFLRAYTWGLDVTGSVTAAGGVGALLQVVDIANSNAYYPSYDGSGNVSALVNASDGTATAIYEYGPFGEQQRGQINGDPNSSAYKVVAALPFRYSTKFTDVESGLVYYGLRYYSPNLGRFINRDPQEEAGGVLLYAFCQNDGLNYFDYLGLGGAQWVYADGGTIRGPDGNDYILLPPFNGYIIGAQGPLVGVSGSPAPGGGGGGGKKDDPTKPKDPKQKDDPSKEDDCAKRRTQLEARKVAAAYQDSQFANMQVEKPAAPSVSDAAGATSSASGLLNGLLKNTQGGGSQALSALGLFATSISFGEKIGTAAGYAAYGTPDQWYDAWWDAFSVGAKFIISAQVGAMVAKNPTPVGVAATAGYAFGGALIKSYEYASLRGLERQDLANARQNLNDRIKNFLQDIDRLNADITQYNHDCAKQ